MMNSYHKIIELKPVKNSDIFFLFELLLGRVLNENISHKKQPLYKKHVIFVKSKPYKNWYIIYLGGQKIGSIYLTNQNEIGVHLNKKNKTTIILSKSLKILMQKNPKKRYLVNVSPKNVQLSQLLKKLGFRVLQKTYELYTKK